MDKKIQSLGIWKDWFDASESCDQRLAQFGPGSKVQAHVDLLDTAGEMSGYIVDDKGR